MAIGAEQHEVPNAGGREQAGHEGREAQHALQVELRDHHARRAVGHQAHQRGGEYREQPIARKERGQSVLTHRFQDEHQRERYQEDEEAHLHGVRDGAHHD